MKRFRIMLLLAAFLMLLFSCDMDDAVDSGKTDPNPGDEQTDDQTDDGVIEGNQTIGQFKGKSNTKEMDAGTAYVSGTSKSESSFVVKLSEGYEFNELAEQTFKKGTSVRKVLGITDYSYPDGVEDIKFAQTVVEGSSRMVLRMTGSPSSAASIDIPIQRKFLTVAGSASGAAKLVSKDTEPGSGISKYFRTETENVLAKVSLSSSSDVSEVADVVYAGNTNITFSSEAGALQSGFVKEINLDLINTALTKAAEEYFKDASNVSASFGNTGNSIASDMISSDVGGLSDLIRVSAATAPKEGDTQLKLIISGYPKSAGVFTLSLKKGWFNADVDKSSLDIDFSLIKNAGAFSEKTVDGNWIRFINGIDESKISKGEAFERMTIEQRRAELYAAQTTCEGKISFRYGSKDDVFTEHPLSLYSGLPLLFVNTGGLIFTEEAENQLKKGVDLVDLGGFKGLPSWLSAKVYAQDVRYGNKGLVIQFSIEDRDKFAEDMVSYDPNKQTTYRFVLKSEWVTKADSTCMDCIDDVIVECPLIGWDRICEGEVCEDTVDDDGNGGGDDNPGENEQGSDPGSAGPEQMTGTGKLVAIESTEDWERLVKGSATGIVVFEASKPGCGYCDATRTWLDKFSKEPAYAKVKFYVGEALGRGDLETSSFEDAVKVNAKYGDSEVGYGTTFGTPLILIYQNGVPKYGISQPKNEAAARSFIENLKTLSGYEAGSGSSSGSQPGSETGSGSNASSVTASDYFTRITSSGAQINLKVNQESDIWYIYTNTSGSSKQRPSTPALSYGGSASSVLRSYRSNAEAMADPAPMAASSFPTFTPDFSKLSGKGSLDAKADYGETITISNSHYLGSVTAKRKYVGSLIETKAEDLGGSVGRKRRVYVYAANDGTQNRNDIDYNALGEALLKEGEDNDIFDRVVDIFGSDWGYFHQGSSNRTVQNYFIPKDENITIVVGNICARTGAAGGYESGTYWKESMGGVGRRILALDADCLAGDNIGSGLTTLAHEFQHLVHGQFFNENNAIISKAAESGNTTQEIFSAMVESYLARFITEKVNKPSADPFGVGAKNGSKNDSGVETAAFSKYNGSEYWRPMYNLGAFSSYAYDSWTQTGTHEEYGNGNTLAYYLLVNYGVDVYKKYMEIGLSQNIADMACMIKAINAVKGSGQSEVTKASLIADMQTAAMLSKVPGLKAPYAFNNNGWFTIGGLKVPSVNMWLYPSYPKGTYGYSDSSTTMTNDTNNIVRVKDGQKAGTTYSATAPNLPNGVMLTVVAVPK